MFCGPSKGAEVIGRMAVVSVAALGTAACVQTTADTSSAPPPPVASGALPPGPPVEYRVASGSASVLAQYPRGTEVTEDTRICLEEGQRLSILGSNGQEADFVGPGCMQRARPGSGSSGNRVGGFIFGYRGDAEGPLRMEAAD